MRFLTSLLALSSLCLAQEYRAIVSGTISDSTGAAMPGVRVVARSIERQVEYPTVTNDAGRYVTPFLPSGAYQLTAEKEGFRPVIREGITLTGVDRVNLDLVLEVGSVTDRVTVTSEAPLLQTETAVRSGTITTSSSPIFLQRDATCFNFNTHCPESQRQATIGATTNFTHSATLTAFR
jgi:hypothetical protein